MKTRYAVALSMIAGAALGATAIQGLHAQAKKVYFISESQILDRSGLESYGAAVSEAITKAGGTTTASNRVIAVLGDAPQRVGVTEFPSVEKAQAWINSDARKALAPQRDKVIKFTRQYIVEGN